jgi:hypothetical protein
MENTISLNYYNALRKRYEAQIEEAKANLCLYFSSTHLAAIGEHSDLLAEHDRWIEVLATATDKLQTLNSIFDRNTMKIIL